MSRDRALRDTVYPELALPGRTVAHPRDLACQWSMWPGHNRLIGDDGRVDVSTSSTADHDRFPPG
jgi:hypothetical protein